ncbi:hypothetical protein BDQ94DRAFT_179887 [Aspergillus welwitschiae]|uniref:Zn(2)-C6 fungal-type domain-containing protein n=1 Tax=Aspergillus welwitschiae TaxID=1341132 RepID=A0A3F3PYU9_9EURO|nr:hypothetical protein BDQ94DRAFT_179887 [Aspergillus welwitschiae]RDH32103.1 hypothetical protein BDQ94DRAFT_179887 [Aspergillus welwitschiae]
MADRATTLARGNGKQKSCEACQKTKVKCDYKTPSCGRCSRRGTMCLYSRTPGTNKFRITKGDASAPYTVSWAPTRSNGLYCDCVVTNPRRRPCADPPFAPPREDIPAQGITIHTVASADTGFLGPTSYRAEVQHAAHSRIIVNTAQSMGHEGAADAQGTLTVELERLEQGLRIIDYLNAHATLIRKLVDRMYTLGRLVIIPKVIMRGVLDSLWEALSEDPVQSDPLNSRCAVHIFENSYKPMPSGKPIGVEQFCSLITGVNVRWETIGNVLVMACLCLCHIPESEATLLDPSASSTPAQILSRLREVTNRAIFLCSGLPLCNELVVCLKYNHMLLMSQLWGNTDQRIYYALGELTSAVYATGMHQHRGSGDKYPKFLSAWRQRCFAIVYSMDKIFATFFGRPPFLNRHYCNIEPVVELRGVIEDPSHPTLERLDEVYCNEKSGNDQPEPPGYLRVRYLLSIVREEILELHLGTATHDVSVKSEQLIRKLQSLWESCSPRLQYSPQLWTRPMPRQTIWFIFALHLEHRYSLFLIQRLRAQKCPSESPAPLLSVAKDILSTILVLNKERERLREIRSDLGSVLLPFGLPTAEVLLQDLLHTPVEYPSIPCGRPSRSDTIRDLILFVSCLEWAVKPESGHFEFAQTIQERFTRLLDAILDPQRSRPVQVPGSAAGAEWPPEDSGYLNPELDVNHFVDWDLTSTQAVGFDLLSGSII